MNKLKQFFTSKGFERVLWVTLNSFLVVTAKELGSFDWVYVPVLIIGLNELTRYINTTYLKD